MRLVTKREFLAMPAGTTFSSGPLDKGGGDIDWAYGQFDLNIKGSTMGDIDAPYVDYGEAGLLPDMNGTWTQCERTLPFKPDGDEMLVVHPCGYGRNGLYDAGRLYWIWDKEDRERLARWLLDPEAAADVQNDGIYLWREKGEVPQGGIPELPWR